MWWHFRKAPRVPPAARQTRRGVNALTGRHRRPCLAMLRPGSEKSAAPATSRRLAGDGVRHQPPGPWAHGSRRSGCGASSPSYDTSVRQTLDPAFDYTLLFEPGARRWVTAMGRGPDEEESRPGVRPAQSRAMANDYLGDSASTNSWPLRALQVGAAQCRARRIAIAAARGGRTPDRRPPSSLGVRVDCSEMLSNTRE
jgi:hypothetical protein